MSNYQLERNRNSVCKCFTASLKTNYSQPSYTTLWTSCNFMYNDLWEEYMFIFPWSINGVLRDHVRVDWSIPSYCFQFNLYQHFLKALKTLSVVDNIRLWFELHNLPHWHWNKTDNDRWILGLISCLPSQIYPYWSLISSCYYTNIMNPFITTSS